MNEKVHRAERIGDFKKGGEITDTQKKERIEALRNMADWLTEKVVALKDDESFVREMGWVFTLEEIIKLEERGEKRDKELIQKIVDPALAKAEILKRLLPKEQQELEKLKKEGVEKFEKIPGLVIGSDLFGNLLELVLERKKREKFKENREGD